eukprot:m.999382 g.999382  ORF g.999382 m.999382 type:complete len:317 (+) comp24026_c0_seq38:266-1216(+)
MSAYIESLSRVRGFFGGSGSDLMNKKEAIAKVLSLVVPRSSDGPSSTKSSDVCVLYLGTATYDLQKPMDRQTVRFKEAGCRVTQISCARDTPSHEILKDKVEEADVIIVSGGNTLFAVDRWESCGLNGLLCDAMMRGAVLCGGSCGAMCWFDSGHSDSNDPSSFQHAMLHEASTNGDATSHGVNSATEADAADESSSAPSDGATSAAWDYIRVPCLGFLPGLCCPHFDKVQTSGINGVHRRTDARCLHVAAPPVQRRAARCRRRGHGTAAPGRARRMHRPPRGARVRGWRGVFGLQAACGPGLGAERRLLRRRSQR